MTDLLNVAAVSRLEPLGLIKNALRLVCREESAIHAEIALFVEGTPIGRKLVSGHFVEGETIDIPVETFPLVGLPTSIRLKGDEAIVNPDHEVRITTADQVFAAVGKGDVVLDNSLVESGSVLINISNVTNGFWTPNVYIRFDTGATRAASVETLRRREEGGCQARLRVLLAVEDFHQDGLSFEILCMDREGALGRIEYRRVDPESQVAQVSRVAADLRSLLAVQSLRIGAIESDCARSLAAMEARLEVFCEYIVSLTYDQFAIGNKKPGTNAEPDATLDPRAAADQIFREIKTAGQQQDTNTRAIGKRVDLPLASEMFTSGWNHIENDSSGRHFRWMERSAEIKLPFPIRSLACIIVSVGQIFQHRSPRFLAKIDGIKANLQCFTIATGLELKITPNFFQADATEQEDCVLTLESAEWGSPYEARIGTDRRELSALIWSVEAYTHEVTA